MQYETALSDCCRGFRLPDMDTMDMDMDTMDMDMDTRDAGQYTATRRLAPIAAPACAPACVGKEAAGFHELEGGHEMRSRVQRRQRTDDKCDGAPAAIGPRARLRGW